MRGLAVVLAVMVMVVGYCMAALVIAASVVTANS
jgi:hypothetical protein